METVEEFLARGGKVQVIPEGVMVTDPKLARCRCGCEGIRAKHEAILDREYTDAQMRRAENQSDVYNPYFK